MLPTVLDLLLYRFYMIHFKTKHTTAITDGPEQERLRDRDLPTSTDRSLEQKAVEAQKSRTLDQAAVYKEGETLTPAVLAERLATYLCKASDLADLGERRKWFREQLDRAKSNGENVRELRSLIGDEIGGQVGDVTNREVANQLNTIATNKAGGPSLNRTGISDNMAHRVLEESEDEVIVPTSVTTVSNLEDKAESLANDLSAQLELHSSPDEISDMIGDAKGAIRALTHLSESEKATLRELVVRKFVQNVLVERSEDLVRDKIFMTDGDDLGANILKIAKRIAGEDAVDIVQDEVAKRQRVLLTEAAKLDTKGTEGKVNEARRLGVALGVSTDELRETRRDIFANELDLRLDDLNREALDTREKLNEAIKSYHNIKSKIGDLGEDNREDLLSKLGDFKDKISEAITVEIENIIEAELSTLDGDTVRSLAKEMEEFQQQAEGIIGEEDFNEHLVRDLTSRIELLNITTTEEGASLSEKVERLINELDFNSEQEEDLRSSVHEAVTDVKDDILGKTKDKIDRLLSNEDISIQDRISAARKTIDGFQVIGDTDRSIAEMRKELRSHLVQAVMQDQESEIDEILAYTDHGWQERIEELAQVKNAVVDAGIRSDEFNQFLTGKLEGYFASKTYTVPQANAALKAIDTLGSTFSSSINLNDEEERKLADAVVNKALNLGTTIESKKEEIDDILTDSTLDSLDDRQEAIEDLIEDISDKYEGALAKRIQKDLCLYAVEHMLLDPLPGLYKRNQGFSDRVDQAEDLARNFGVLSTIRASLPDIYKRRWGSDDNNLAGLKSSELRLLIIDLEKLVDEFDMDRKDIGSAGIEANDTLQEMKSALKKAQRVRAADEEEVE